MLDFRPVHMLTFMRNKDIVIIGYERDNLLKDDVTFKNGFVAKTKYDTKAGQLSFQIDDAGTYWTVPVPLFSVGKVLEAYYKVTSEAGMCAEKVEWQR